MKIKYLPLLLALIIYSALSLYQLTLPGLHYDEAQEVIPALDLLLRKPYDPSKWSSLHLLGRDYPLMVQNYIGALNSYLSLPFFAIFGINVFSLRLMTVMLGGLTLLLAYRAAEELFSDRFPAYLTALLIAVNPSFIFFSRQGAFVTSVLTSITVGSLLFLLLWRKNGHPLYLYAGNFLLGLGLWAKLSFIWFIGGLVFAALVLGLPSIWQNRRLPDFLSPARAGLATLSFLLGISPLLIYNLQTQGTVQEIARYLQTSYYGINNLAFFANLAARLDNLRALLDGGHFWYLGATPQNFLYPVLFFFLVLGTVPLLLLDARGREGIAFLLLLLLATVPWSTFTISDFKPTHYVLLLPIPQMLIAGILFLWGQRNSFYLAIATLLALALVASDLNSDLEYHRALARTGGYPDHSAAIYDLAAYLEQRGDQPVVAMDWGFRKSIYFLTKGEVDPDEIFGYESFVEPDPGFAQRLQEYLGRPETLYIFHSSQWTIFKQRWEAFQALVQEAGRRAEVVEWFYDRSGMEVFLLVQVVDQP